MTAKKLPVRGAFADRFMELLNDKMKDTGMKMEDIAIESGISKPALSNYQNDAQKPGFEALHKIASYFNVSLDYLAGRTDVKNPDISDIAAAERYGLSNKAIETLKYYVQEQVNGNYEAALKGLNTLLETEEPYRFFQYVHYYMSKIIDKPIELNGGMEADIEAGIFRFGEYTFQPDMLDKCFLLAMQEYVMQAREKEENHGTRKAGTHQ